MALATIYVADKPFVWFKYTCFCSWLIIVFSLVCAFCSIAGLSGVDDVKEKVCNEPEVINASFGGNCSKAFTRLSQCNLECEMIHSVCMRNCFLQGDDTYPYVAFTLAVRYDNYTLVPSFYSASLALLRDMESSRRRLDTPQPNEEGAEVQAAPARPQQAAPTLDGRTLFPSLEAARQAQAQTQREREARLSPAGREALVARAEARAEGWLHVLRADAEAEAQGRPARGSATERRLSEDDPEVEEAYQAVAIATAVAIGGAGSLADFYGCLLFGALLNIIPAAMAIHALGGGCCRVPDEPAIMYKRQMRCSCHWGWFIGTGLLMGSALTITKFQVLMRYMTSVDDSYLEDSELSVYSSNNVPSVWGYKSVLVAVVPCMFGVIAGALPTFNAMCISRSRAERRECIKEGRLRQTPMRKMLTGPQKGEQGPVPNPATLGNMPV